VLKKMLEEMTSGDKQKTRTAIAPARGLAIRRVVKKVIQPVPPQQASVTSLAIAVWKPNTATKGSGRRRFAGGRRTSPPMRIEPNCRKLPL
jgi:hypothetical protein